MNHDCHGDIFTRFGKRWGRCFGGGEFFEFLEGTEFCPVCKRPWCGTEGEKKDWSPDEDNRVLVEIDLPHYKFLAEERGKKAAHLAGLLEHWQKMHGDIWKELKAVQSSKG